MLIKRGALEGVQGAAPQRLSDMVKAGLLEPQCPAGGMAHPSATRLRPTPSTVTDSISRPWQSLVDGRCVVNASKGMSGEPKSLYVSRWRNMGSPKGREPYGDGVFVVVAGVTPRRGERESRSQGEGRQVVAMSEL